MAVVDYESIQVPEGYLNMRINQYRRKYIMDYLQEYGTYPSIEDIVNIPIPDEVMTHIKQSYYVNYLINEADKIDGDVVVPDDSSGLVTANDMNGCWKLISGYNFAPESIEVYIEFDRTEKTFCLYQKLDSFDGKFRKYSGRFQLEWTTSEIDTKTILNGQYYPGENWATRYYITIVDDKMRLVATHDDSIVQEYVRIDSIPEEVINQATTDL
jgi:hypothetical protein